MVGNRAITMVLPGNYLTTRSIDCFFWKMDFWKGETEKSFQGVIQVYFIEVTGEFVRATLEIDKRYASEKLPFYTDSITADRRGFLYQHVDIPSDERETIKEKRLADLYHPDDADFIAANMENENDPLSAKICFHNLNSKEKFVRFKVLQLDDTGVPQWVRNYAPEPNWEIHDLDPVQHERDLDRFHPDDPKNLLLAEEEYNYKHGKMIDAAQRNAAYRTIHMQLILNQLEIKLIQSISVCESRREIESIDRNIMEQLHSKVNRRGILHGSLLLMVSGFSAIIIRSFFANRVTA